MQVEKFVGFTTTAIMVGLLYTYWCVLPVKPRRDQMTIFPSCRSVKTTGNLKYIFYVFPHEGVRAFKAAHGFAFHQ